MLNFKKRQTHLTSEKRILWLLWDKLRKTVSFYVKFLNPFEMTIQLYAAICFL